MGPDVPIRSDLDPALDVRLTTGQALKRFTSSRLSSEDVVDHPRRLLLRDLLLTTAFDIASAASLRRRPETSPRSSATTVPSLATITDERAPDRSQLSLRVVSRPTQGHRARSGWTTPGGHPDPGR